MVLLCFLLSTLSEGTRKKKTEIITAAGKERKKSPKAQSLEEHRGGAPRSTERGLWAGCSRTAGGGSCAPKPSGCCHLPALPAAAAPAAAGERSAPRPPYPSGRAGWEGRKESARLENTAQYSPGVFVLGFGSLLKEAGPVG